MQNVFLLNIIGFVFSLLELLEYHKSKMLRTSYLDPDSIDALGGDIL